MPGTKKRMTAAERKAAYEDYQNFERSASAAPSMEEMNAVGAKDPKEFFMKLMEKEKQDKGEKAKMADGGMARGKGGKMYKHNYATGGSVTDHLSRVVGPQMGQPQSVQAATATVETPAQRSKRLRMGG